MSSDTIQEPPLPQPNFKTGKRRFWKLSELLQYEAAAAGDSLPEPLPPEDERFLTAAQVRKRYGGVSDMWLWRRLNAGKAEHGEATHATA